MTLQDNLNGLCVLVVEDDYMVASDLVEHLEDIGAQVVGPAASVEAALSLVKTHGDDLDCASLDVNLRGERVFPVADALIAKKVPFIFSTGYDERVVPDVYSDVPRCEKPIDRVMLTQALVTRVRKRRE